jgi:hypothetical protein
MKESNFKIIQTKSDTYELWYEHNSVGEELYIDYFMSTEEALEREQEIIDLTNEINDFQLNIPTGKDCIIFKNNHQRLRPILARLYEPRYINGLPFGYTLQVDMKRWGHPNLDLVGLSVGHDLLLVSYPIYLGRNDIIDLGTSAEKIKEDVLRISKEIVFSSNRVSNLTKVALQ